MAMLRVARALALLPLGALALECETPSCQEEDSDSSLLQLRNAARTFSRSKATPVIGEDDCAEKQYVREDGAKCYRNAAMCPQLKSDPEMACRCCAFCEANGTTVPACDEQADLFGKLGLPFEMEDAPRKDPTRDLSGQEVWEEVTVKVASQAEADAHIDDAVRIKLKKDLYKPFKVFVDDKGREVTFAGTNAVVKGFPWIPTRGKFNRLTSLGEDDFKILRMMGITILRLGIMWPGVEPAQCHFNNSYLEEWKDIMAEAKKWGIWVLADFHQDFISEYFCGEGAPQWLVEETMSKSTLKDFPAPSLFTTGELNGKYPPGPDGLPTRETCHKLGRAGFTELIKLGEASTQLAFSTGQFYQKLYDYGWARKRWFKYWEAVTTAFKGVQNLVGYDLFNEPWSGDIWSNLLLLVPQIAELLNLQGLYNKVVDVIRREDREALMFYNEVASHMWDPSWMPNGFLTPPGGFAEADRSVLAYHYYRHNTQTGIDYAMRGENNAYRLRTGVMMTESCCSSWQDYVKDARPRGHSMIKWEYKAFCYEDKRVDYGACITGYNAGAWPASPTDQATIEDLPQAIKIVEGYLRNFQHTPYVVAAQGTHLGTEAYQTTVFTFRIHYDPKVNAPTEIYWNPIYFPVHCGSDWKLEVMQVGEGELATDGGYTYYGAPSYRLSVKFTGGVARQIIFRISSTKAGGCSLTP